MGKGKNFPKKLFFALTVLFLTSQNARAKTVKNISVSLYPLFAEIRITLAKKTEVKISRENDNIFVFIEGPGEWEEYFVPPNKYVKGIWVVETEKKLRKTSVVHIKMASPDLEVVQSIFERTVIVFVGRLISQESQLELYMENVAERLDAYGLTSLFAMLSSPSKKLRLMALWWIARFMENAGKKTGVRRWWARAGLYFGAYANLIFPENPTKAIEAKIRSFFCYSKATLWEKGWYQILIATRWADKVKNIPTALRQKLLCSAIYSYISVNKIRDAQRYIAELRSILKEGKVEKEAENCVLNALALMSYERGDFEKAVEFWNDVDFLFIKNEPLILIKYSDALLKTDALENAKKLFVLMRQSRYPDLKGRGYLGLYKVLAKEGKWDIALIQIYKLILELPGTIWDARARVQAVKDRHILSMQKVKVPQVEADPLKFPLSNIKYAIVILDASAEGYEALALFTSIAKELAREDKLTRQDLALLLSYLKMFSPAKARWDIWASVSKNLYDIVKLWTERGRKIEAVSLWISSRQWFPEPWQYDYSFLIKPLVELGYMREAETLARIYRKSLPKPPAWVLALAKAKKYLLADDCMSAYNQITKVSLENAPQTIIQEYEKVKVSTFFCFIKQMYERPEFKKIVRLMCEREKGAVFVKEAGWMCRYIKVGEKIDERLREIERKLRLIMREEKSNEG